MDNNDSNIKPGQTGGLGILTVMIAVLALHVVVIGGVTVYHLMSGGSADADLITTDKTHKDLKGADGTAIADAASPNASQGDKSAPSAQTATPPTEVATIPQAASGPAIPPAPATGLSTPTVTTAPALAPVLAPAPAPALTTPTILMPPPEVVDQGTPSGPISSELAPPAEPAPAPSATMASGPVHMPAIASSPAAPKTEREHQQTYVVKITDSYKKIAHTHHITVAQLKEANHIKTDVLHTGQKLVIPLEKKLVADNAATPATTLDAAPAATVLSTSATPMTTSLSSTTSTAATTGLHHHLYTVVKGDTLSKIAHKFKTTATALMAENKLKIPSEESRSARISAPASTQPVQAQAKENAPSGQLANFVP